MSVLQLTSAMDETDDERWKEWDRGIVSAEWACQKADVWQSRCSRGELRDRVGAFIGLAGWGNLAGGAERRDETEQRAREREEEQACELCDDYQKTQGPSVFHPARPRRHRAGSLSRCAGLGNTREGGGRSGETAREMETIVGVRRTGKDKLEKDRGEHW